MNGSTSGVSVMLALELRQRVRGTASYVLLAIFVGLVALVTVLLTLAYNGLGGDDSGGGAIFSSIIFFVMLLGTLLTPALSGNAVNGDRESGTLATTQVTLVTPRQIILGKFLAAWITALAFLVASVPFLVYAAVIGDLGAGTIVVSTLVLAVELGVIAAIGVGLSGILNRPLMSIVTTYLLVAALSIGTVIAFGLGGLVVQTDTRVTNSYATDYTDEGFPIDCAPAVSDTVATPRFDYFWGVLVANPYVLLADAVPTEFDRDGYPTDLFGSLKSSVRSTQLPPEPEQVYDECAASRYTSGSDGFPTPEEIVASTVPGWFVGLAIHLVLAAIALTGGWSRTRTPAGRLTKGSRIA